MAQTVQRDEAQQRSERQDPLPGHLLQLPLREKRAPERPVREEVEAATAPELVFAIAARRTAAS